MGKKEGRKRGKRKEGKEDIPYYQKVSNPH
jgi:hypothetical protein